MREGGKSELYIPSGYAYGAKEIKGETYANLIFYVELCEIKHHDSKH
jgi:FKBP-type peptidyl-prolyl cis-trans isomerase